MLDAMDDLTRHRGGPPDSSGTRLAPSPRQLQAFLAHLGASAARNGHLRIDARSSCVIGRFLRAELTSAFQTIWNIASGRGEGVEALVRCASGDGDGLSPWQLFMGVANDEQAIALDRLCRTVHALNFLRQGERLGPEDGGFLFLKVHPRLVQAVASDHGRAFANVLEAIGLNADQVVIELPAEISEQPALAVHACANYRWNGFKVALDFSRPASAAQAVQSMRPDYVKVDARDLRNPVASTRDAVATARAHGTVVIAKRCELASDVAICAGLGVDLAQGFGLSLPVEQLTHRTTSPAGAPLDAASRRA